MPKPCVPPSETTPQSISPRVSGGLAIKAMGSNPMWNGEDSKRLILEARPCVVLEFYHAWDMPPKVFKNTYTAIYSMGQQYTDANTITSDG